MGTVFILWQSWNFGEPKLIGQHSAGNGNSETLPGGERGATGSVQMATEVGALVLRLSISCESVVAPGVVPGATRSMTTR